ncbi:MULTISPECIES: NAD-glutamate dehydrogenase domain-containing protein [unclassified Mycolicibacterium]|uniref:NAD-glutamate dehydrogenase domain-containing protein n=1 Tax=unclassified Mycolicibacterium TaxID=2636767 RepID=UPI002ED9D904
MESPASAATPPKIAVMSETNLDPQANTLMPGTELQIRLDHAGTDARTSVTIVAAQPVTLRRFLPLLDSLDIEALDERATTSAQADGSVRYSYEFTVQAGGFTHDVVRAGQLARPVEAALLAMWHGLADADDFNALVVAAGLSWQQVAVLRALARYLLQTGIPYGERRIQQVLLEHPGAAGALIDFFNARFGAPDTSADDPERLARVAAARTQLADYIQAVVNLDADRVLRAYTTLIDAMVRTNAFLPDVLTPTRPWLSFKFVPADIDHLPHPRPLFEIFVYSPTVEGVHLRFGAVSRGGVRWSDRLDDYRTEVLGLVKAQEVKNAVIVPAGAKGVFVSKPATPHVRHRRRNSATGDDTAGINGYRQFISGMLDLTDNRTSESLTSAAPSVVCYDQPDPYLVVAADKGTARFSDVANDIATGRGFWLGDAFASGGATGYDHKAIGITARGAWVSTQQHLRQLDIDVNSDDFTAVGIGDMSGDVFGNGMLLSPHLGLVAAFDHRHIFCDPTPDRAYAFAERRRLFELPGSSWDDYDRSLISAGGGVWPRNAKTIPLSQELSTTLGIPDRTGDLTPDALVRAILSAPVDLLWNGGIGTYVKASTEQHSQIGDKFNDSVRINASDVRARVITEGGNLGVSASGRVEYARRGGLINSDAIDNAAGVDCSDHEVNIKIVLDTLPAGTLTSPERTELLASMADEVSALVLRNNVDHNYILSSARHEAARMVQVHANMVGDLETRRGLHRERQNLPSPEEFEELVAEHTGLTTPQLATLMAHVKLDFKDALTRTEQFDDPHFTPELRGYFPAVLRQRFLEAIDDHPLRREILSTVAVNEIVAVGGLPFAYRLADDTGATVAEVARAYRIAAEVFDLPTLISTIQTAGLPIQLTNELTIETRRLLDRASRWLLSSRPQPLDVAAEVARFKPVVNKLGPLVADFLQGGEAATVRRVTADYLAQGVPAPVAKAVCESLYLFSVLDITEAADADRAFDTLTLAQVYFALSDHLGVDELLVAVSSLPRGDRWHAQARLALRDDFYRSLKSLTIDVLTHSKADSAAQPWDRIRNWENLNQSRLQRSRRSLASLLSRAPHNLASLSVAATHIRRMTILGQ